MKLIQRMVLVLLGASPSLVLAAGANPPDLEQQCRQQYAKVTNTPESAIAVKYAGRDDTGRHVIKGTVTIGGKEQPIQCTLPDPDKAADAPAKK